jgi:hypothetical protein
MKHKKGCMCISILVIIIVIVITIIRIIKVKSIEHLTTDDLKGKIDELSAKFNAFSKDKPKQFVSVSKNYIAPPPINHSGINLSSGRLTNGTGNILNRAGGPAEYVSPYLITPPKFTRTFHTWFYEKDGTIRNQWDSISNQNGGCLYKHDKPGKCTNSKYKTAGLCREKGGQWIETIGLTKNNSKCSTFTHDAFGRMVHHNKGHSSGTKKCMTAVKTKSDKIIVGLDECHDNKISMKQLWSFH